MSFWGNPRAVISAIDTSGGIASSRTSGKTPCFVQVSASAITATGTSRPYEDLEYRWDFGDSSGTELFTNRYNGVTQNANYQTGPEAAYCYRSAGSYTVTLTVRGLDSNGDYITATKTLGITVTAFSASGGEYWFDSVDGSDSNDGLSSSAPKQSITALNALIASNVKINLKRGSHWTAPLQVPSATIDGARLDAYGSGAKPIVEVSSGTTSPLLMTNGSSGTAHPKTDMVFSNIKLYASIAGTTAITLWNVSNATAEFNHIYLDNCDAETVGGGSSSSVVVIQTGTPDINGAGLWNCSLSSPLEPDLGNRQGLFGGARNWSFVFGCSIEGGGSSQVLDHHIYPTTRYHALYKWINFGYGSGKNYCINNNYTQVGASLEYAEYHCISECHFSGALRGHDASNGSGDETKVLFRNFVSERCLFDNLDGDGLILFYCCETMTVRDHRVWGCNGGHFFEPDVDLVGILTSSVYRNYVYRESGSAPVYYYNGTWTVAQQVTDNVTIDLRTYAQHIALDVTAHTSAGSTVDYNQYYSPNDTSAWFDTLSNAETWAQWQALGMDVNGTNADPSWIDPTNGVFDVPSGRVAFGLNVVAA